jgi:hypothetical protein
MKRMILVLMIMVFMGSLSASFLYAMSQSYSSSGISILSHTGRIKITKPYGGTANIGPYDEVPAYIPMGSRIEVVSGSAEVQVGDDNVTLEKGEMVYIWGDEATGSLEFSIIPLEPKTVLEAAEPAVEEASPSSP